MNTKPSNVVDKNIIWQRRKILLRDALALLLLTLALIYFPYFAQIRIFIPSFLSTLFELPISTVIFLLFIISALIVHKFSLIISVVKEYLYGFSLWVLVISCFLLFTPTLPWTRKEQWFQFALCFFSLELLSMRYRTFQFRRDNLKSEDMGLDDPLKDPATDKLNHADFSDNIFEVVQTLPDNNARIAITGEWGCGKTTCLNFIESFAKKINYPVIRFNPWKFDNKEELWKGFVAAVDTGIATWKGITYGPFKHNKLVLCLFNFIRKKLSRHEIGRLFNDLIFSKAEVSFDITKEEVSLTVLDMLRGKKLLVLIDDLDRASQDIVFQILLLIKEIVDVKGCVFICCMDIDAIQKKLDQHETKNENQFVEKIFQFRFAVPIPGPEYKKNFVSTLLERLIPPIRKEIVIKYQDCLPDNPRKLKAYFRLLSALDGVLLKRFGDKDLSWEFLYLAELLKIKYPERMELIKGDQLFYEWIEMGFFYRNEKDTKRGKELLEWTEKINKLFPEEQEKNTDFRKITDFLSKSGFGLSKERIKSYFKILTYIEPLTWKEYKQWKQESKENLLKKLVNNNIPYLQRREFLLSLMREREQLLAQESDEWNHDKREKLLAESISIINDCLWYVKQTSIISANPCLIDVSLCGEWLNLLGKWAHFKNNFYSESRTLENELAITLAKQTSNLASEILEKSELFRDRDFLSHEQAFYETKKAVKDIYMIALSNKLIADFEKEDSIKKLWGAEQFWPEKNLLFKLNKYFYSVENKTKLREFAERAKTSRLIQGNFHEFLRMLFYAALDPMSSIEKAPALDIIKDDELRELFWAGATSVRIQRRSIGDFLKSRKELIKILQRNGIFPIPDWVRLEETDLLEIYKA